jgi:hypothetical protein
MALLNEQTAFQGQLGQVGEGVWCGQARRRSQEKGPCKLTAMTGQLGGLRMEGPSCEL